MTWWKELYDSMYSEGAVWFPVDEMTKLTASEVDFLEEVLKPDPEMKILDLGCGRGRHCLELSRRKYNVTGIDISEKLIEQARKDAEKEKLNTEFICRDMKEIDYEEEFDVVLFMDVSFGIFNDEENEELIKKVFKAVKKDGQVFFVLYNPYRWATNPHIRHWGDEDGEVIRRYMFNAEEGRIEDSQIYISASKGIRKVHPIQSLRAYTIPEMRRMCREAGFSTYLLFGDRGDFLPSMDVPFNAEQSLGMYLKVRK